MKNKKNIIEFDEQCPSCGGTGLYVGFAEHDGAAVVCKTCKGTGCHHMRMTFHHFTGRKKRRKIERVFQTNPGIGINVSCNTLEEFGGIPYNDWLEGKKLGPGTEMRKFVCPAWWYQSADYDKKPQWDECNSLGSFRDCPEFKSKDKCWKRFDAEQGKKTKKGKKS